MLERAGGDPPAESVRVPGVEVPCTPNLVGDRFIPGEGVVHHRVRMLVPWPVHVAIAGLCVSAIAAALALASAGPLIALPVILLLWPFVIAMRVTVSERSVHVHFGISDHRIETAAIDEVEALTRIRGEYRGWGIGRERDGAWGFRAHGDDGRGVRIRWRGPAGEPRVTVIGTREPEVLAAAIERARASVKAGPTRGLTGG